MKVNLKEPKKLFTVRLSENIIKDIRLLSVDLDMPVSEIIAEAVRDVVQKYGRTQVTYSTAAPESKKGKR